LSTTFAGIAFLVLLVAALVAVHVPPGDYMYRVYTSQRDWRVEKAIYRVIGVDPEAEEGWGAYARRGCDGYSLCTDLPAGLSA
jgi:potassium-transporting ATPase potassium-binding subunit